MLVWITVKMKMNYNTLMKMLDERVQKKADFKDKDILRNSILDEIIANPSPITKNDYGIYHSKKNPKIIQNNKLYLQPNLYLMDNTNQEHYIYVKLGYNQEEHTRGHHQLNKLNSYIKKNKANAMGYMMISDKKYNSIEDYLDKVQIYTTRV